MPCRILIKENVENFVDKNSQRGLSMSLQDANILASNLNAKMKNHVVSFYNDGGKVGRTINIPNELVDKYFDIEVKRRTPITSNMNTIVKDGVPELFDSNSELANAVYESLDIIKPIDIKLISKNLSIDEGVVLKWQYSENIDGDIYNFDLTLNRVKNNNGLIEKYLDIDFDVNDSEDIINKDLYKRKERLQQILQQLIKKGNQYSYDWLRLDASEEQGLKKAVQRANLYERVLTELGYTITNRSEDQRTLFLKQPTYAPNNVSLTPQQKEQAQQLYSQYVDSIFPDSQVKDIVYHIAGFERYNPKDPLADEEGYVPIKERFEKFESIEDSGVYFAAEIEYINYIKERVSKKRKEIYATIINLKKPINWKTTDTPYMVRDKITAEGKNNINDGVIGIEYEEFDRNGYPINNKNKRTEYTTYWVKSDEQTHILGTKQDVEGFKNFVASRPAASTNKFELDIKNLNLTPEVINYLYQDSRAKSQGRDIENYKKEISKLINNLQSDFTNSEILETLKCI